MYNTSIFIKVKKNMSIDNKQQNNSQLIEKNEPTIFNKKRKIVIEKPLTYIESDTGKTRHFTPAAQEWYNSIYSYNTSYLKSLPVADKNLMDLLKSYFNAQLNKKLLKTKTKPLQTRFKRLSTKRTFVGKGHIKHTNNKVTITFFVYNTEGMFLSSLFRAMKIKTLFPRKPLECKNITRERNGYISISYNRWFTLREYLYQREHKGWYYSYLVSLMDVFIERLNKINSYFSKISDLVSKDILNLDDKLTIFNDKYNNILFPITLDTKEPTQADIKFKYPFYYNYELKTEKDYMSKYFMYRLLLKINKLKFNDTFLYKLIYLVNKIYKKKVEFNIVNLKKMHLNSDIYTQAVSLKLRNKDNRLYRILKASLRKIKLPTIRKISEKQIKPNKNEFIINKIRNNIISFMFKDDNVKDPLSNLLLGFYPLANNIKVKNLSVITGGSDREENKGINNVRSIYLTSYVRKWLKHMKLRGIRVEAKGRLTRRATASRSVFKMKWKGGLKNVDSSFRGLSTIMLRGHAKSNVQYSLLNSKNRNGAFGVKGWVSSK
jgi:Mitochondrial ribosomal protein (VAR1)